METDPVFTLITVPLDDTTLVECYYSWRIHRRPVYVDQFGQTEFSIIVYSITDKVQPPKLTVFRSFVSEEDAVRQFKETRREE